MARKTAGTIIPIEEHLPEVFRQQAADKEQVTGADKLLERAARWLQASQEWQDEQFDRLKIEECRDLYRGRHYLAGTISSTFGNVVNNQYARIINTLTPVLGDARGRIGAAPREYNDSAFAEIVDSWSQYYDEQPGVRMMDYMARRTMANQGTFVLAVEWDEFMAGGEGDVRERDVLYSRLFLDPLMRSHNPDNSRWIIEELVPDPYRAELEFGIKEEDYNWYNQKEPGFRRFWGRRVQTPNGQLLMSPETSWQRRSISDRFYDGPRIYRVWFRNKDNPKGLRGTIVNGKVTEVIANPNPHGHFPYVFYQDQPLDGTPWALGVGFHMTTLQHEVNRNFNIAIDQRDLTGNPPLRLPDNISITEDDWRPHPGWIVRGRNAEELKAIDYLNVPGVSNVLFEMMNFTIQQMETHAGLTDGQMGRKPESVVTSRVFGQLMEAGSGRIREEVRHVEQGDVAKGQRRFDLALHNMSETRFLRTASQQAQQAFQRIKRMEEIGPDGVSRGHYFEIAEHQGYGPDGSVKGRRVFTPLDPRVDIIIYTESSLPLTQRQKFESLLQMHEQGLVDQQTVLDACPWLNSFEIIDRMQKAAAQRGGGPQRIERVNINLNASAEKVGAVMQGQRLFDAVAQQMATQLVSKMVA